MIIFYDKITGEITGTIRGRLHNEDQLRMWIGDENENGRIICQWKKTETLNKDKTEEIWEPEIQTELFTELEKNSSLLKELVVDTNKVEIVRRPLVP